MSSDLRNKLFDYEASPPGRVWASLSDTLDEALSPALTRKLENFEAAPPPAVWEKISGKLQQPVESSTPVVPFFTRYRRPLKYSGAIAVMVLLAVLVSLTISKKTVSEIPSSGAASTTAPPEQKTTAPTTNDIAIRTNTGTQERSWQGASARTGLLRKSFATRPIAATHIGASFASFTPPRAAQASAITADARMDNYMVYADDEGRAVRLPKKMFDAVACPTASEGCRERLKRMQEKIAAAAISPDFGGLLDLLNHLKENQ